MFFRNKILFLIFISTILFGGCQSVVRFSGYSDSKTITGNNVTQNTLKKGNELRDDIVRIAEKWLGTSYCWGGETKKCVDCSGFVSSVYSEAGISLPRVSRNQYSHSKKITRFNALPGDLVFFKNSSVINHVGIYIGNNTMIHSSSSYGVIKQSINSEYYKKRLAGFGRVINQNAISSR